MREALKWLLPIVAISATVGLACWLIRTHNPALESLPPLPVEQDLPVGSLPQTAPTNNDHQILIRLVDLLDKAQRSGPKVNQERLAKHWRRMRSPWHGATSAGGPQIVALLASEEERSPLEDPSQSPEVRTWNKNLGAFEQWTSLQAAPGEEIEFSIRVPQGGFFRANTASIHGEALTFRVLAEAKNGHRVACERALKGRSSQPSPWQDFQCDLGQLASEEIALRLKVEGTKDAVGLWGGPRITGRREGGLPWNVLWIVVDALRPDAISAMHHPGDDARWASARRPAYEAWLPRVNGLTPHMDRLIREGVSFRRAHSNGAWTRPGTLAMLSGLRSSQAGIDPDRLLLTAHAKQAFYAARPPLLPLTLGQAGARTDAIINNYFLVGYATVGLDLGFDHVFDVRHQTEDTAQIEQETLKYLDDHASERFFLFCNFVSPHSPYEPPPDALARVPMPPSGPSDPSVREYLGEVAKDDASIGRILDKLGALGLRRRTLVVLTADHGEVMSQAHNGMSRLGMMSIRFGHINSNYEETTRIPIVLSLPGVLPEGKSLEAPVQSIDLPPTVEQIENLPPLPRPSGRSLLGLALGADTPKLARPIVSEGRFSRALLLGRYRYIERRGELQETLRNGHTLISGADLYDLEEDPGETAEVSSQRSPVARRMKQALRALTRGDAEPIPPHRLATTLWVRVPAGKAPRSLEGTLKINATSGISVTSEGSTASCKADGAQVSLQINTTPGQSPGCRIALPYPTPDISWELRLDGRPIALPELHIGPLGSPCAGCLPGLLTEQAMSHAFAEQPPYLDPSRDEGVFVWLMNDRPSTLHDSSVGAEQLREAGEMFRGWGYAHGH